MREPLDEGEVHVGWLAIAEASAEPHRSALAWMTSEERQRHDRYVFEHSREEYRLTRFLVRSMLSQATGVDPADWRFTANAWGRPEIEGPAEHRGLRFNATNTRGLVAVALAHGRDVGLDAEDVSRPGETESIAPRFFAPREVVDLRAQPEADRKERFFAYWTLKESYIKARGMGLALPLDAFAFDLSGTAVRIAFDARIADEPESWRFEQHRPTPQHRLALAVRAAPGERVRTRIERVRA